MKNKNILIIGFILMAALVFLFFYIKNTQNIFSQNDFDMIRKAKEDFIATEGHDPGPIIKIFRETNLKKSLTICEEELLIDPVRCYRLLAIVKPEEREHICSNINVRLCKKYATLNNCNELMGNHKKECLLLLPFFR